MNPDPRTRVNRSASRTAVRMHGRRAPDDAPARASPAATATPTPGAPPADACRAASARIESPSRSRSRLICSNSSTLEPIPFRDLPSGLRRARTLRSQSDGGGASSSRRSGAHEPVVPRRCTVTPMALRPVDAKAWLMVALTLSCRPPVPSLADELGRWRVRRVCVCRGEMPRRASLAATHCARRAVTPRDARRPLQAHVDRSRQRRTPRASRSSNERRAATQRRRSDVHSCRHERVRPDRPCGPAPGDRPRRRARRRRRQPRDRRRLAHCLVDSLYGRFAHPVRVVAGRRIQVLATTPEVRDCPIRSIPATTDEHRMPRH
jgi:hypothetical protein